MNDSTDAYVEQDLDKKVKQIHKRIKILKQNRDMEKNYMHYLSVEQAIKAAERDVEEVKKEAEEEKRKAEEARNIIREMLFDSIAELGEISETVHKCIKKEEDINNLKSMHKTAIKSESMEQFEKQIVNLY